jgi:hypothetical protein
MPWCAAEAHTVPDALDRMAQSLLTPTTLTPMLAVTGVGFG